MEKMGVPSVPIITKAYLDLAKSTAAQRGMPTLRIAYTVHPIWGLTGDQVRAFLDTNDPVSNQPFMKEVIAGLTSPLTAEDEKTGLQPVSPGPATFGPDTLDNLQAYFMNNQMTDYMPIVVPAEAKVAQMLKGTSHKPDEVVGRAGRTANGAYEYTVKQVAVNAVMAGCDPSCFPIVLALAASGELALGGSTTSFGYAMVINGPIRDKLNMNYGIGALSGFAQPNATIGRAWSLLGKNLGAGALEPKFDEQIGSMLPTLARMYNCLVVLDPLTVNGLVEQGYDTKEKLQQYLWKNYTVTAKEYRESFLAHVWLYPRALKGEEPMASWWKLPDDAPIPLFPRAENIELVVCGGQTNAFFQVANMNYGRSFSIDKWM